VRTVAEPIIVVLGPWCGGTSAVAKVLHHLGVLMGTRFDVAVRELQDTWEDADLSLLCRRAFSTPGAQLQWDPATVEAKFRSWADDHRRAARAAGRRPGVKHPVLCAAVDLINSAWGPIVPVVVERPAAKVVASLNRLGWWKNEQERAESTEHLMTARDRALAGVATVRVDFEELRAAPAVVIRRLADELGLDVTESQFEDAVNSVVRQHDMPQGSDPHQELLEQYLGEAEKNPDDPLPVHMLAQIYFRMEDHANAGKYSERLIEMGVPDEDVFLALLRIARSLEKLGKTWPEVQDAYLRAWEFRSTRAEPFYCIARHYRVEGRYRLGYLFAQLAANIPLPAHDMVIHEPSLYARRAVDEQAVCAARLGEHGEALTLCRQLLRQDDLPDEDRYRITVNRDLSVPAVLEAVKEYPEALIRNVIASPGDAEITVSMIVGSTAAVTEATLNSFLQCCSDIGQVGRFVMFDHGESPDRSALRRRYPFLEFVECAEGDELRAHIHGRYWLHVDPGWVFFAQDDYITRPMAIFAAEPEVIQVGINLADATGLTGANASEKLVRRGSNTGRYVMTDVMSDGPAMFDIERLDRVENTVVTATLDEVLCIECAE